MWDLASLEIWPMLDRSNFGMRLCYEEAAVLWGVTCWTYEAIISTVRLCQDGLLRLESVQVASIHGSRKTMIRKPGTTYPSYTHSAVSIDRSGVLIYSTSQRVVSLVSRTDIPEVVKAERL